MSGPPAEREEVLENIRRTYRSYRESGRNRIWAPGNPGYARMLGDRDRALVDLVRRSLPPAGSVLDLGCGLGDLADLVRQESDDLTWTGVDLLPEATAEARRLRPWAAWIEASADRLPLSDAAFDVVVASTLFSSLPLRTLEQAAAVEIARVLRPAGWLVWYDLRYDNPRNSAVHGVTRATLGTLFDGWRTELRSATLAPPLARRLGFSVPLLYPLLVKVPFLRSHLLGRLQRPD